MSRSTDSCGWITAWTLCPSRLSSIVTESTRKGMSSVTTSTTDRPDADQPDVGERGRHHPYGGGALRTRRGELTVRRDRAEQVLRRALGDLLRGHVPVVGTQQVTPCGASLGRCVELLVLGLLGRCHAPTIGPVV